MKPKEYLSKVMQLKRRYQNALEELEYIRSMASGVTAIRYDKDQIQSSPNNDQMANYMIRLEKAEARALKLSEEYFDQAILIRDQINSITPGNYSDILYLRYVQGLRLWEIADELGYSHDRIRHMHGMALVEFGKRFLESSGEKQ